MVAYHDHRLVLLSIVISILGAYAARGLSERISAARGSAWLIWLIAGASADGIGTWSMHYTAMLGYHLPIPVLYDWPTVLFSLFVGICGSTVALLLLSRHHMGWALTLAAAVFMGGVGIGGLHYTAMMAMRLQAMHHYSPGLVTLSVALAIAISGIALTLLFRFPEGGRRSLLRKHAATVARGAANPVMHYTAMAAVTYSFSSEVPNLSQAVRISTIGVLGISIVPLMVVLVALLTSLMDWFQKQKILLDELFEQAPQAVALVGSDNRVVRVNREFVRLFGYLPRETLGRSLSDLIVPEEARPTAQRQNDLIAQGQRLDEEVICQRKDGSRLHASVVGVTVSMPGGQIAAYAIYRDITERKRAEEELRRLSGRLLKLEDEERRRLARSLHDSTAQVLVALGMNLSVVNESAGILDSRGQRALQASLALADQCLDEIRTVSYLLHPPELDEFGLQSALPRYVHGFVQRSGIQVEIETPPDLGRLPKEMETTIFKIVQECLTNIHRHSGSRTASIRLTRGPSNIVLEVKDSGGGIRRDAPPGVGIASMRERLRQLDGSLDVMSDHTGTTIKATIPLSSPAV